MVSTTIERGARPRVVAPRLNLPAGVSTRLISSSHPVRLCGLGTAAGESATPPIIVRRTEEEFLPALFHGLSAGLSLSALGLPDRSANPNDFRDGHRYLFQPVHRTFNCAVLEASCRQPGFPRLDPRKVASAGCVVRRVRAGRIDAPELDEAWLHQNGSVLGWKELASGTHELDPDPKLRVRSPLALSPQVHQRLAALLSPLTDRLESVSPLFVAPPEVCDAAGKTILYGLVPVTSGEERSEARNEPVDDEVVLATTPHFLKALDQRYAPLPPGYRITPAAILAALDDRTHALNTFLDDLRLVSSVWGAFDDSEEARQVVEQLNRHQVLVARAESPAVLEQRPLGDFLGQVVRRLVLQTEPGDMLFPANWMQPPAAIANDIRNAARGLLAARLRDHGPRLKRFDEPGALYRLHCFVRVRCADGCPPELHWALPSEPFSIAPWWDSNATPVHTISLPDLTPDNIKRLKPNVAFVLPPKLAALLNQDPEELQKGKAQDPGSGLTLGWICSFSIPIITLCAFIVLNIFLMLFKLIFSILFGFAFSLSLGFGFGFKLCLPFPKSSRPRP